MRRHQRADDEIRFPADKVIDSYQIQPGDKGVFGVEENRAFQNDNQLGEFCFDRADDFQIVENRRVCRADEQHVDAV